MARLMAELGRLPGVGPKTAQRLAYHILRMPREQAQALADAIVRLRQEIRYCSRCFNLTDVDPCRICQDSSRQQDVLCVVQEPRDVMAIEGTREYHGLYHVLHGALSPLQGIGPENLRIKELLSRLQHEPIQEVIVATNPTVEGEATGLYIARLVRPLGIRTTRLAQGLPMGADLEYTDEATLAQALVGRKEIS
ncbi:MAG: recombination protein RecR [Firmicutes bacterium]|nr:recombination protein RecR [Bacillota bacterium]